MAASLTQIDVINPRFGLTADGAPAETKLTNMSTIAAWQSSSSKHDCVGVEKGALSRNATMVCYLNGGHWVQQHLDHEIIPGKFYTVKVDAIRSAERAENVIIEIFTRDAATGNIEKAFSEKSWRSVPGVAGVCGPVAGAIRCSGLAHHQDDAVRAMGAI